MRCGHRRLRRTGERRDPARRGCDGLQNSSRAYEEEPLAPLLRKGDDEFDAVVDWAVHALVNAEALGISAANVDALRASTDPAILSFFQEPPIASGLAPDWTSAIVKATGNYGEIFDRHLGAADAAHLPRGPNRLWTEGGLLYAPPIR